MTLVDADNTQTSRRRLLEAGKALFARFGFEQTSTAIIAREAGTSESQLVRYYKGKAGLLEAIFNDCWAALNQHVQGVVVAATDAREALAGVLETVTEAFGRMPISPICCFSKDAASAVAARRSCCRKASSISKICCAY